MKQISKKAKKLLIASGLLLLVVIGMTVAYYNSQKDFQNKFATNAPGVAIREIFDPSDFWVPGEEKSKQVWFTNTGEMDMFLRFTVDVEWNGDEQPDGVNDDSSNTSEKLLKNGIIKLYLRASKDKTGASQTLVELNEKIGDTTDLKPIRGSDGKVYYYYKKVLKAGEDSTNVLESVTFDTHLSNDGHKIHSNYSNVQINVAINGETVLANPDAAEDEWGMSATVKEDGSIEWKVKETK